ncbi:MAG: hypothetical protein AAFV49_06930 [Pseudomonadota bacterium]
MADGSRPNESMQERRKRAGDVVRAEIAATGLNLDEFSQLSQIDYKQLSAVLNGRRIIDAQVSNSLSNAIGRNDKFWLTLEKNIDDIEQHKLNYPKRDMREKPKTQEEGHGVPLGSEVKLEKSLSSNEFRVEFRRNSLVFSLDAPESDVERIIERLRPSLD